MAGPKFDLSNEKGLAAFNGFMGSKSYVEGYTFTPTDTETFAKFNGIVPNPDKLPHAYRWYVHIAALTNTRGIVSFAPAAAASAPAPAPAAAASKSAPAPKAKAAAEEDDFDVFGDDDEEDAAAPAAKEETGGQESRAEMLARLKKEAEERTAQKEAKQRTLVAIEIKPWDVEQDLMALWKKITETVVQDGLKWGENCTLADVAYGIKKIQCTFVMGVSNSSDDVVDKILEMEDEVQSCEVTSMNVL